MCKIQTALSGWMAEWLCSGLQSRLLRFDSGFSLHKINYMNKKISVFGLGYVGTSLAVLLSKNNHVTAIDIDEKKVALLNNRKSPVDDNHIDKYLKENVLNLSATKNYKDCHDSDFIILAVPTSYSEISGSFDTSIVEGIVSECITINKNALIVIKSTVPIGFTDSLRTKFDTENIVFSPEFLREGFALHDNLFPSRIIMGSKQLKAEKFAELLSSVAQKNNITKIYSTNKEAEAIKLFSNTYLALRIAFFNELDSFGYTEDLDVGKIIQGIYSDNRIGDYYNNPSFGYGGYCLPKDSKQLLAHYVETPQNLIKAVSDSNKTRINYISDVLLNSKSSVIGFYKFEMKKNSGNFRSSATLEIFKQLKQSGKKLVIYEPSLNDDSYEGVPILNNLQKFKQAADVIVANRMSQDLSDVIDKVFTRDLYNIN